MEDREENPQLSDDADLADSVRVLKKRLESARRGVKAIPAEEFLSDIRQCIFRDRNHPSP
jgi:hypothetical protein